MLSFESDYTEGAHEEILKRLVETNFEQLSGYGNDKYCDFAKQKIKAVCKSPDAQVFLLVGGTQTNQIVIDTVLKDVEGVISAETGHVSGHEAGAIEFTGHKVLTLPHDRGKLKADDIKAYLEGFYNDENHSHMVYPGMVYISQPTEYGTLYSLKELTDISDVCKAYNIPLYLDGARLGYALSSDNDVTLEDIARLCDVFYIGGTKVGAFLGEAVVFPRNNAPEHFFTSIKQHGALLAKGRILGVQFDTLFTDGLYFKISRHAIEMADKIRAALREKGYKFFIETVTNQIFVVLDNQKREELSKNVAFGFWERIDKNNTVVRLASSWATKQEDVDRLIELL